MEQRPPITLYTDGAASGNPGPGGFGAILICGELRKELYGGFAKTTNNRMELLAVISGLEAIKWKGASVNVYSDSTYVVKAINEGWLSNWIKKGFKKTKNVDLWQRYIAASEGFNLTFNWVKGHADNEFNNRCDELAVMARSAANLPEDEGYCAEDDKDLKLI